MNLEYAPKLSSCRQTQLQCYEHLFPHTQTFGESKGKCSFQQTANPQTSKLGSLRADLLLDECFVLILPQACREPKAAAKLRFKGTSMNNKILANPE